MRPLFGWHCNLTGYDRLLVLFTVTFWCLYGCAVSGGGKTPKDLNERNIAVLVLARDSDPYSWRGAKRAFTPLTNREASGLEWKLLQEVEGSGLFEHVTRYEDKSRRPISISRWWPPWSSRLASRPCSIFLGRATTSWLLIL